MNGLYKVLVAVWITLGLASCASFFTTLHETYAAIVWRIEDKAAQLKDKAVELKDKAAELKDMAVELKDKAVELTEKAGIGGDRDVSGASECSSHSARHRSRRSAVAGSDKQSEVSQDDSKIHSKDQDWITHI